MQPSEDSPDEYGLGLAERFLRDSLESIQLVNSVKKWQSKYGSQKMDEQISSDFNMENRNQGWLSAKIQESSPAVFRRSFVDLFLRVASASPDGW